MRKFTREELAELDRIATGAGRMESRLRTAMGPKLDGRNGYIRNLTGSDALRMFAIYKEATGTNERFYPNCGECVLKMVKRLAAKYYADLKSLEEEPAPAPKKKATAKKK